MDGDHACRRWAEHVRRLARCANGGGGGSAAATGDHSDADAARSDADAACGERQCTAARALRPAATTGCRGNSCSLASSPRAAGRVHADVSPASACAARQRRASAIAHRAAGRLARRRVDSGCHADAGAGGGETGHTAGSILDAGAGDQDSASARHAGTSTSAARCFAACGPAPCTSGTRACPAEAACAGRIHCDVFPRCISEQSVPAATRAARTAAGLATGVRCATSAAPVRQATTGAASLRPSSVHPTRTAAARNTGLCAPRIRHTA